MGATESSFCKGLLLLAILVPSVGCGGSNKTSPPGGHNGPVTVQLAPSSLTLKPGDQQQFTATVTGADNNAVTWSVDSIGLGNSNTGLITTSGMYTAPQLSGAHTITATSVADSTKNASASVTVQGTVSISPATAGVNAGGTQQFTVAVEGQSNPAVTWSVDTVNGGNSAVGTIDSQGNYTAPSQVGTHTITANVCGRSIIPTTMRPVLPFFGCTMRRMSQRNFMTARRRDHATRRARL